jgi:hypothetical protein
MAEKKAAPKAPKAPKPEPPAPPAQEARPRKKKMNDLSLAEIEAKLAECQEKQGGLISKYASQLLARKKTLTS